MSGVLKKPGGPFRVLHSAAALRKRRKLSASRAAEFRKAYQYIRRRTKLMQYHEYKRLNLPIGSGVTEAACKTVVSQRLKLSGMRWMKHGAQTILNLRIVLLSGIWQPLYRKLLETHNAGELRTYGPSPLSSRVKPLKYAHHGDYTRRVGIRGRRPRASRNYHHTGRPEPCISDAKRHR